ncbi:MAG: 3-deoxy-7-phosphoheptulonate synthase [Gammaproteobacteria bacterium]|nr:3-deoxy-7-phosphoheptulonate synthase [Gammaproteobacteria bacterium]
MFQVTDDARIVGYRPLIPPAILLEEIALTERASQTIAQARRAAERIIQAADDRLLVVVGPCSIHDPKAALEYADKLQREAERHRQDLLICMRVYFEKPRTTIGWKGLINDPHLDGSFDINNGLRAARRLLLELAQRGLPAGTEFLDVITPQFIADLIAWGAIGARTTESQIHREMASGLSMPVGFKNGTDGSIQVAVDAIGAARHPHHFLAVAKQGISAIVTTKGNENCHVILRGSNVGPNHHPAAIAECIQALSKAKLKTGIMVDCSHGNSRKDHRKQPQVAAEVGAQIAGGERSICGLMLESHLREGKQSHSTGTPLVYGQSITDACLSWEMTVPVLDQLAEAVQARRAHR